MKYVLAAISLFCPILLWSQTLKGKVVDEADHKSIESASISILDAGNIALSYTLSDADGLFEVNIKDIKASQYIYIVCLGYRPIKQTISTYKNNGQIYLTKTDISLKEVIVKNQPIKQSGDTLSYQVSAFRLFQDRSIKDVLKRLPGIEVEDDGKIKYQGKAINKFYVEGLDLADGRYNLVSNNLNSKLVKTVQILEKHQPISALRNIDFSDEAALNLVLEEAAKGKILSAVDLGFGAEKSAGEPSWENRVLALCFNKKLQDISLYKNANTGNDIKEDIIDFKTDIAFKQLNITDSEPSVFSPLGVSDISSFKKRRYFFNDSHFASTNTLARLTKNSFIRIQGSYLHEKERQNSESRTTYFLPDATIDVQENLKIRKATNQMSGRIAYELNGDKNYIKNMLNASGTSETDNGTIGGAIDKFSQRTVLDKMNLSNNFSFVHQFSTDKVFKFGSTNSFDRLPQQIAISPGLYEEFINDSVVNEKMTQNVTISSFNSHSFTSFSHSLLLFNVAYDLGLDLKSQVLESYADSKTSNLLGDYSDSLSNKYRYSSLSFYLSPTLKFQREYLKISLALKSTLKHFGSHDVFRNGSAQNKTTFLFEPTFLLSYDINAYWRFSLNSSFEKIYSDIRSLYSGYILNSYRNATKYGNDLAQQAYFNNTLSLSYKHPIKGLFINLSATSSRQYRNNLIKSSFTGILQRNSIIKKDVTNNNLMTSLNLKKTLPFWGSVADFRYNFMESDYTQYLSEVLTNSSIKLHRLSLSLTISPTRQFNFTGSVTTSYRQLKTVSPEPKKYPSSKNSRYELMMNYAPIDKFSISWNNELYDNGSTNFSTYYSDIYLSYFLKHSEIQFSVNNISNETKYEKYDVSSFSQTYNLAFLHGRQFLIKYLFSI